MNNKIFSGVKIGARHILAVSAFAISALPAISLASVYGYVDSAGFVRTVEANEPMTAIAVAPNIDAHSGVILIVNPALGVFGALK